MLAQSRALRAVTAAEARLASLESRLRSLTESEERQLRELRRRSPRFQRQWLYSMVMLAAFLVIGAAVAGIRGVANLREWSVLPYSAVVGYRVTATMCYARPCWVAAAIVAFTIAPSAPIPTGPDVEALPAFANLSSLIAAPLPPIATAAASAGRLLVTCWWPVLVVDRYVTETSGTFMTTTAAADRNGTRLCAGATTQREIDAGEGPAAKEASGVMRAARQMLPLGATIDGRYSAELPGRPV